MSSEYPRVRDTNRDLLFAQVQTLGTRLGELQAITHVQFPRPHHGPRVRHQHQPLGG